MLDKCFFLVFLYVRSMLAGSRMYMYMYICTCTCTCSCLHAHFIVVVSTTRTCRLPAATCVPMHVSTRICTCTCTSCVHAHRERRAHHAQICMEAQGEALTQHGILFLINSLSHSSLSLSPSLSHFLSHTLTLNHSLTHRQGATASREHWVCGRTCSAACASP